MSSEMFTPKLTIRPGKKGYLLVIETLTPNGCHSDGDLVEGNPDGSASILEWDHLQAVIDVADGPCTEAIKTVTHTYELGDHMPPPGKAGVTVHVMVKGKEEGCAERAYLLRTEDEAAFMALVAECPDEDYEKVLLLGVSGEATHESIAGGDMKLTITAQVRTNTGGYSLDLVEADSTGLNEKIRLMKLVATPPSGPATQAEEIRPVEHTELYQGHEQVMVYYGKQSVTGPITVAHS